MSAPLRPLHHASAPWAPVIDRSAGPLYLAIADAIAADIASGVLKRGARLPPQRALAEALGVDFTTVSRAYAEARRRGLVAGKVGQGTWITDAKTETPPAGDHPPPQPERNGLIDISMNLPPPVITGDLAQRLWRSIATTGLEGGADLMMRYQEPGGARRDREAGAQWLAPRLGAVDPGRLLACPGAQSALLAVCATLCAPGDAICASALTYPGLIAVAAMLRLRVIPIALDDEGMLPDALAEALAAPCANTRPRLVYCNPTLCNPTTHTMSLARRQALLAVASRNGVMIVEDDAYGQLAMKPPPALAHLAPDQVCYIAGMAKCVAPALRVAWLAAPDMRLVTRLAAALSASSLMASPLTVALAATWIRNGLADEACAAIRKETRARTQLARRILPTGQYDCDDAAFHLWLRAPATWSGVELAAHLRAAGVAAVAAKSFAVGPAPEALRLGLGVAASRAELERRLHIVQDLLERGPEARPGFF